MSQISNQPPPCPVCERPMKFARVTGPYARWPTIDRITKMQIWMTSEKAGGFCWMEWWGCTCTVAEEPFKPTVAHLDYVKRGTGGVDPAVWDARQELLLHKGAAECLKLKQPPR